jgi:hypothetical protein
VAPTAEWAPKRIVVSAPPRELPVQDHAALDEVERRARVLTRNVGLLAAAVLAVLLIVLASQRMG